jgi:hypothetical protein
MTHNAKSSNVVDSHHFDHFDAALALAPGRKTYAAVAPTPILCLKGQSHEIFDTRFFQQTIPLSIRIYGLKPFRI